MRRFTLLLFLLLSLTSFAQSTKPLSKKEAREFVEQMKTLLSANDYESAISLSHQKSSYIEVKNIAKADRAWWENTKERLDSINTTFINNEARVKAARTLYNYCHYWECNEAISAISLDPSCAKASTISDLNSLKRSMEPKFEIMTSINAQMPAVIELYQNKDTEQLFWTFFNDIKPKFESTSGDITNYLSPDYLPSIKAIIKEYGPQWESYRKVYYSTVTEPSKTIESLTIRNDMGCNVAKKQLELFNSYQARIENCLDYPADQFPILAQGQKMVRDTLPEIKKALNSVIKESDPLKTIMTGKQVSLAQIESDCSKVSESLVDILSMDVCSYYDKRFSTDLQKSVFMESDGYKTLYKELQGKRKDVLNTVYFSTKDVKTGSYVVQEGCFYLELGSNDGSPAFFGAPARVHHPKELDGVVHESFSIGLKYNRWVAMAYTNGDRFVYYNLKLPVPKSVAASYENTDCKLVVCFIPAGAKAYRVEGASYDGRGTYDIFYANKIYPYSTKCRVLLFTKNGELIFDKIL